MESLYESHGYFETAMDETQIGTRCSHKGKTLHETKDYWIIVIKLKWFVCFLKKIPVKNDDIGKLGCFSETIYFTSSG